MAVFCECVCVWVRKLITLWPPDTPKCVAYALSELRAPGSCCGVGES